VNRNFFFLVVSQYPVSIDSYPIKHRGHAGLSLGLMSPLFDGEPSSCDLVAELPLKTKNPAIEPRPCWKEDGRELEVAAERAEGEWNEGYRSGRSPLARRNAQDSKSVTR
jgi:hypothetical protein